MEPWVSASDDVLGPLEPNDRGGDVKSSPLGCISTSDEAVRLASLAANWSSSGLSRSLLRTVMKNKCCYFNTVNVRVVEQLKRAH